MVVRKFFQTVVNGDFYVALVSSGLALTIYTLYEIPLIDLTPIIITILITFMIYAINRQVDQHVDAINLPGRTMFVKKYGKILTIASLFVTLVALYLAYTHSTNVFLATIVAALVGYYYSYPIPFIRKRFKDHFVWKNIGVGFIYATLALITIAYFSIQLNVATLSVLFLFFSSWFLISSFFDFRDIEGDKRAGIKTIPLAVGKRNVLPLFHFINILPVLVTGLLVVLGLVDFRFIFAALFTFLYTLIYLIGYVYKINMKFLCMVVADATPFVVSLFLFFIH